MPIRMTPECFRLRVPTVWGNWGRGRDVILYHLSLGGRCAFPHRSGEVATSTRPLT